MSKTNSNTAYVQLPRFEYQLVRLARFSVGQLPAEAVVATLGQRLTKPDGISGTARKLLEETLINGSVLRLCRAGGWRADTFLRHGIPKKGRVWERGPIQERRLLFTAAPFDFLVWMQTAKISDPRTAWQHSDRLSAADEFFFFQLYESLAENSPVVAEQLRGIPAIRQNPLIRLFYPDDFADHNELVDGTVLVKGLRSVIVECLQPHLQNRWLKLETLKPLETVWLTLLKKSEAQERTLSAFLKACNEAQRPDLARFVLGTAQALLSHAALTPADWTAGLNSEAAPPRLADRLAVHRSALGFLRQLLVLQNWDRAARSVGYLDDEYAASQLWKRDWEQHHGAELCQRASRLLEQLEPLRAG